MSLRKKRPKCSGTHFLSKLMHMLNRGKSSPKMRAITAIFIITVLSKQSPIVRKFGQSGHPGPYLPNKASLASLSLRGIVKFKVLQLLTSIIRFRRQRFFCPRSKKKVTNVCVLGEIKKMALRHFHQRRFPQLIFFYKVLEHSPQYNALEQGCQIFLGTTYQSGKKYTEMATKYTNRP
jgi:hypothetical protein